VTGGDRPAPGPPPDPGSPAGPGRNRSARLVAVAFEEFADLLEILGGPDARKAAAYRRAAVSVREAAEPLEALWSSGRLETLPGIGPTLARKIDEYLRSGRMEALERLRQQVPPGVLALMSVPGLGPRTAGLVWRSLGVASLKDLEAAARAGRLRQLPGMGPRREEAILRGLETVTRGRGFLLAQVLPAARLLAEGLGGRVAGAAARGVPVCEEAVVVVPRRGEADLAEELRRLAAWAEPPGPTGGVLASGLRVRVVTAEPRRFGWALVRETSDEAHLRALAARARRWPPEPAPDEAAVYGEAGLDVIPPELREGDASVQAAAQGRLPRLLDLADVRGDLHVHTRWSDGSESVEDMALAARDRGYAYLVIADHSRSLRVARGLDAERLRAQRREIEAVNRRVEGIRVLQGCEVEIGRDGELDFPDEVLAELDVVIAALHNRFGQDGPQLTERLLRAIAHPHVDVIAHPTGRRLGIRDPFPVDMERIIEAAVRHRKALEVNGSPERLDLDGCLARTAREAGALLCVDTDAHAAEGLDDMRYAVMTARRGWLSADDVLNALPLEALLERLGGAR
jgi:DNA polymerase (family 10)